MSLGGQKTVLDYWAKPALQLGFELLSQLSGENLAVRNDQLSALSAELNTLAQQWIDIVPDDVTLSGTIGGRPFTVPLLVDLINRMNRLRDAIRIAELTGGHLQIW